MSGESCWETQSRAMLGFHHFTGADWGGKFAGLPKQTWMTAFLSLDGNDPVVETISRLGEGHISMSTDDVSEATPAMPASPWRHSYARCSEIAQLGYVSWTPHSTLEKDNSLNYSCLSPSMGWLEYMPVITKALLANQSVASGSECARDQY